MGFWDTRLAGKPAQAPARPPEAPAQVVGAWFSNPLLNGLQHPAQQSAEQEQEVDDSQMLTVNTKKPMASRNARTCPECGGGNYGRAKNSNNYERCFECGYNDRFMQAMAGAGVPSVQGESARPSLQVASGGGRGSINNFHPDVIIGRISE